MRAPTLVWIYAVAAVLTLATEASAQAHREPRLAPGASGPLQGSLLQGRVGPTTVASRVPGGATALVDVRAPTLPSPAFQSRAARSATRTIATHALVGAGAGLLIGWALKGANVSGDDGTLLLVWGSIGLGAGLVSGVITWLVDS